MAQTVTVQEEWLKVLGKGMVTLPKRWREDMGISEGDVVKAKKEGSKVVIETRQIKAVPYRIYTDLEINKLLEEDRVPKQLIVKAKAGLSRRLSS